MDTWFGPAFCAKRIDDPASVGLTVHRRNKHSLFEMKLEFTDFLWSYSDGIKTFEIEEACAKSELHSDKYYFNRYVHSERDVSAKQFRHLDGAVKVFLKSTYDRRRENHLPDTKFADKKLKLWRIDGDIPLDEWLNLIVLFFKSNEMIIEYFNPDEFKKMFPLRVRDFVAWKQKRDQKS